MSGRAGRERRRLLSTRRRFWRSDAVTRAAGELEELARILDATRKRAEAVAARRVAADLRAVL
jgi:hypothetical protein